MKSQFWGSNSQTALTTYDYNWLIMKVDQIPSLVKHTYSLGVQSQNMKHRSNNTTLSYICHLLAVSKTCKETLGGVQKGQEVPDPLEERQIWITVVCRVTFSRNSVLF